MSANFIPLGLELTEHEEIFGTVVALKRCKDVSLATPAAIVAQGGQNFRISLTGENGCYDSAAAHPVDVAENMVQLEVHLGKNLLDAVHMSRILAHKTVAVSD